MEHEEKPMDEEEEEEENWAGRREAETKEEEVGQEEVGQEEVGQEERTGPRKQEFDHKEYCGFADSVLERQEELGEGINLHITENKTLGSAFLKYAVYHIEGSDKNGQINVFRRFNEFYKMRVALVKRFPGCFIPSIPEKAISIVDDQIINKRQRYLSYFIRKMSKLSHLYNSEEFQALLRSEEKDLSSTFEKWPNPTPTEIINKYKAHFGDLAGKVITTEIRAQLHDFQKMIVATEKSMMQFKDMVKALSSSRDKFDMNLPLFFSKSLPSYEQQCLVEYVGDQSEFIAINQAEAKFQEHEAVVRQSLKHNPYWLLYDLLKHEERDGKAFLESIKAVETYENKKHELEVKISENSKSISELMMSKKSNSEQKYKLEVENENYKKQKEAVECLTDIIIALVAFIEQQRFKREKTESYQNYLRKLGGYEINMVQNLVEIWKDWNRKTAELIQGQAGRGADI